MVQLERSWAKSANLSSLLSVIEEAMDSNTEHNYGRVMDPDMDPGNRPGLDNIMVPTDSASNLDLHEPTTVWPLNSHMVPGVGLDTRHTHSL